MAVLGSAYNSQRRSGRCHEADAVHMLPLSSEALSWCCEQVDGLFVDMCWLLSVLGRMWRFYGSGLGGHLESRIKDGKPSLNHHVAAGSSTFLLFLWLLSCESTFAWAMSALCSGRHVMPANT